MAPLEAAVKHRWYSKRSEFAVGFRYVDPFGRFGFPGLVGPELVYQFAPGLWWGDHHFVHACRFLASIELRDPSYTLQCIGVTPQQQPL